MSVNEAGVPMDPPGWFLHYADKFDLISTIENTVRNTNERLGKLSETVEFSSAKLNDMINQLKHVKVENEKLQNANIALKKEVDGLKSQVLYLESQSRRDNLLFDGLEETNGETWEACERLLVSFLSEHLPAISDLKFERVHRIGDKDRLSGKPRQIVAKFSSYKQRDLVWSSRFDLQGTKVWVSEDYPQTIKLRRQKLMPYFQAAKRSPEITSTSLKLDKLFINKKLFTVETISQIPEPLQLENSSMIKSDETVVFASKHVVLSNLYPCPITIEGQVYNSTEQYIQCAKARLFNDNASFTNILKETDTFKQMMLGKKITHFKKDIWRARVRDIMMRANNAKYLQNQQARETLMATGDRQLGEATIDPYFGIGQRLASKTVNNKVIWAGKNVMGSVLEEVRSKLISS
jgi:ribA/ribD-fused uncharacterized protein